MSGRCAGVRRYWWHRETCWNAVCTRGDGDVHGGEHVTRTRVVVVNLLLSSTKDWYQQV
jgi:hypothetical protein